MVCGIHSKLDFYVHVNFFVIKRYSKFPVAINHAIQVVPNFHKNYQNEKFLTLNMPSFMVVVFFPSWITIYIGH